MNNYKSLFWHSQLLGIKSILKGFLNKESLKRIVCPMDFSRYYELPVVLNNLRLKKNSKILDISSPKLLASYISSKHSSIQLWGIDKFKDEISNWSTIIGNKKNLVLEYGDSTKLKYPDNFFDEVYSISVIEHVGNNKNTDDSKMMKEVYRVLKKKGRFYFTTIISRSPEVVFKNKNYYSNNQLKKDKVFFCRIYSYSEIVKRLLNTADFKVIKEEMCNYRFPIFETIFNKTMPYSAVLGFLNYFVGPMSIRSQKVSKPIPFRAEYFCILQK